MSSRILAAFSLSLLLFGACSDSTGNVPDRFRGCDDVEFHRLGDLETGTLTTSDCVEAGSFIDFYTLSLSSDRNITIDLSSNGFDTYLVLYDRATGAVIEENDDDVFGFGTDSRIEGFLQAGDYIIGATSFDPDETGTYTLETD